MRVCVRVCVCAQGSDRFVSAQGNMFAGVCVCACVPTYVCVFAYVGVLSTLS